MLTQVRAGRLSLFDYVRLTSTKPAEAFGLYPAKGALLPGSDADNHACDLNRGDTIAADQFQSRSKITPFEGMKVTGIPMHTLVRGRFVMKDRQIVKRDQRMGTVGSSNPAYAAVTTQEQRSDVNGRDTGAGRSCGRQQTNGRGVRAAGPIT